jgi:septation ring formation regulator EzrA
MFTTTNNIYVRYMGHEISIAQHVSNGITSVQEVGILPASENMHIVRYDAVLPSLIAALEDIRDEIDKGNIPQSCS